MRLGLLLELLDRLVGTRSLVCVSVAEVTEKVIVVGARGLCRRLLHLLSFGLVKDGCTRLTDVPEVLLNFNLKRIHAATLRAVHYHLLEAVGLVREAGPLEVLEVYERPIAALRTLDIVKHVPQVLVRDLFSET